MSETRLEFLDDVVSGKIKYEELPTDVKTDTLFWQKAFVPLSMKNDIGLLAEKVRSGKIEYEEVPEDIKTNPIFWTQLLFFIGDTSDKFIEKMPQEIKENKEFAALLLKKHMR